MVEMWNEDGTLDFGGAASHAGPTGIRPIGNGAALDRVLRGFGTYTPRFVGAQTRPRGYASTPIYEPEQRLRWDAPPQPDYSPPPMPGELPTLRRLPLPGTGRGAGRPFAAEPAFARPDFPTRIQFSPFGEAVTDVQESAWGPFLGLAPGETKGGTITGPGGIPIATTPLTVANAASWGREGLISLASSLIAGTGRYEQRAGALFGEKVEGPAEEDKNPLDRFIDVADAVGDALWAPFDAAIRWYRDANANVRLRELREIVRTGGMPFAAPISFITAHIFGRDRISAQAIAAAAVEKGLSWQEMAAQLYDLDPRIVREIVDRPNMTDEELGVLARGQPFSRDPAVNIILELGTQLPMLLVGGKAVKGISTALRAPRVIASLGRGGPTFQRTVRGIERLWKVNSAITISGWGVRAGQWAVKQTAALAGDQGVVDLMDRLLWEMPLSTNPGLNLIDGFNTMYGVHLGRSGLLGGRLVSGQGAGRVGIDLRGRRLIVGDEPVPTLTVGGIPLTLGMDTRRELLRFRDVSLGDIQRRIFAPIGWTDEMTNVLFGDRPLDAEGTMPPFTRGDALNFLVYQALSEVRDRAGASAIVLNPADGISEVSRQWANAHMAEAVQLLADTMLRRDGETGWLTRRIQETYWDRTTNDASELGALAMYGPFDPAVALIQLRNWLWVSRETSQAAAAVNSQIRKDWTVALDPTVKPEAIAAARTVLRAEMPDADANVPASLLNRIRIALPSLVLHPRLHPAGRTRWTPRVTRKELEAILDEMGVKQQQQADAAIRERAGGRPAVEPGQVDDTNAVAAATGMDAALTRFMLDTLENAGEPREPIPEALLRWVAEYDGRPLDLVRRNPEAALGRAIHVFESRLADAHIRGEFIDTVTRFRAELDRINSPDVELREALDGVADALRRPPREDWLRSNPSAASVYEDALAEGLDVFGDVADWLEDPLHPIRVGEIEGRPVMLPEGVTTGDMAEVADIAGQLASRPELTDAHVALLANPATPIWQKAAIIRPLLSEAADQLSPEQRSLVEKVGDPAVFRDDLARVMPEVIEPTLADLLDLEARAVAHWAALPDLSARAAATANRIAARPGAGFSSDIENLLLRAMALGQTGELRVRSLTREVDTRRWAWVTAESEPIPWYHIEVSRPERAEPARLAAEETMRHASAQIARVDDEIGRLRRGLPEEAVLWDTSPRATARGRPARDRVMEELRKEYPGIALRPVADPARRNRWLIFKEQTTETPIGAYRTLEEAETAAAAMHAENPAGIFKARRSYSVTKRGVRRDVFEVYETVPRRPAGIEPPPAPPTSPVADAVPGAIEPAPDLVEAPPAALVEFPDGTIGQVVEEIPEGLVVRPPDGLPDVIVPRDEVSPAPDVAMEWVVRYGTAEEPREMRFPSERTARAFRAEIGEGEVVQLPSTPIEAPRILTEPHLTPIPGGYSVAFPDGTSIERTARRVVLHAPLGAAKEWKTAARARTAIERLFPGRWEEAEALARQAGALPEPPPRAAARQPVRYGRAAPFSDPAGGQGQIHTRLRLAEADEMRPAEGDLQPRARGERVTSEEQISEIATSPRVDDLLATSTGAQGTPVVNAEGTIIAGNGRHAGIVRMEDAVYERYRARLIERAAEFGVDPAEVAAMRRPVLVRELDADLPVEEQIRLAYQLNFETSMAVADRAVGLAAFLDETLLGMLRAGEGTATESALLTEQNIPFVEAVLRRIPADARKELVENNRLTTHGADVIGGAIIARLFGNQPGTARLVREMVEVADPQAKAILSAVADAAAPLIQLRIARGDLSVTASLINRLGTDLVPALLEIIGLSKNLRRMRDVRASLMSEGMFAEFASQLDPTWQRPLAVLLAEAGSANKVRSFFRAFGKALAGEAEGLFPEQGLTDYGAILNRAVEASVPEVPVRFPVGATDDVPISPPRMGDTGITRPPVLESQPKATVADADADAMSRVLAQNPRRVIVEDWVGLTGMPTDRPVAIRVSEPGWGAVLAELRAAGARALEDRVGAYLEGTGERPGADERALIGKEAAEGNAAAYLVAQEIRRITGTEPTHRASGEWIWPIAIPADRWSLAGALPAISGRLASWGRELDRNPDIEIVAAADFPLAGLRADEAVVVPGGRPKEAITPEAYTEVTGIPKDTTDDAARAAELDGSPGHVVVTETDANLAAALKEHSGSVPTRADPAAPRVLEMHRPDEAARIARLESERAVWVGRLTEAATRRARADASTWSEQAVTPFADQVMADAWDRLMMRGEPEHGFVQGGRDEGFREPGPPEPHSITLGTLVDAVQALDAGAAAVVGIDEATARALRVELMDMAERTLERAGGEASPAALARLERQRVLINRMREHQRTGTGEAPPEVIDNPYELPGAMADLAAVLAGRIEQFDTTGLDGYTGYQIGVLPRRAKGDRTPLTPRIQYRDFTGEADALYEAAEVTVPGLGALLADGPIPTLARSIENARFSRALRTFVDMAFGPRHERDIAAQTIARVIGRITDDLEATGRLEPEHVRGIRGDVASIIGRLHDEMAANKFARLPIHRRIATIPPAQMNRWALAALTEKHGAGHIPEWWEAIGGDFAEIWRDSDNRVRAWLRQHHPGLADAADQVWYETRAGKVGSEWKRGLGVIYNVARFSLDARWQGLETIEPDALLTGRYGFGAWRDYVRLQGGWRAGWGALGRPADVDLPLLLGRADAESFRKAWAWWGSQVEEVGVFARSRDNAILAAMRRESPELLERELLRWARQDPIVRDALASFGETPEQWLTRLARDWEALDLIVSGWARAGAARRAEMVARFGVDRPRAERLAAKEAYPGIPEIEQAIAESRGNPHVVALYERLREIQHDLYDDLAAVFYGQPDRSNLQRLFNHPLLYWPISYQIKATKWLARVMFDQAFGVKMGAAPAVLLQSIHDDHVRRFREDAEYRAWFARHRTLLFIAQMLLPITPFDMGVTLSPFTRLVLALGNADEYSRNLFGVGPGYTYFSLLPRLFWEETRPGGYLGPGSPLAPVGDIGRQIFPFTIPVRPARVSTLQAETLRPVIGTPLVPFEEQGPEQPRAP